MKYLILIIMISGCVPESPTGAICTPDNFVLRPTSTSILIDPMTWEFVLDEQGSAMTCIFS